MIAIIMPEEDVPMIWQELVKRTYPAEAQPWGGRSNLGRKTEGMTEKALASCAAGTMWTDYEPTPLTREWLEEEDLLNSNSINAYFLDSPYSILSSGSDELYSTYQLEVLL